MPFSIQPTTDAARKRRGGGRAGGGEQSRQSSSSMGPPRKATASVPRELPWLTLPGDLPKYVYLRSKTHTQITQNKAVSEITYLKPTRPIHTQTRSQAHKLTAAFQVSDVQPSFDSQYHFFFYPSESCVALSFDTTHFFPVISHRLFTQHPWLPSICRPCRKTNPMFLCVLFSFPNT